MSLESQPSEIKQPSLPRPRRAIAITLKVLLILAIAVAGFGSGFLVGKQADRVAASIAEKKSQNEAAAMLHQINPPEGYTIPAKFGDIGPQMLAAGAIDLDQFVQLYEQAGQPLTDEQMTIFTKGSDSKVVISQENAYFLLNFFWAFGLVNQNPVLTEGPMMARVKEQVGGFASTGGWTIGAKPSTELYASTPIIPLTQEQQARLMEVATAVYRPCCNNPTHFPDCNHGMAMLGLLELMASQNATADEMFAAAKYINAFWYPQQMLEVATLFKTAQKVDFAQADARQVVGAKYSSASGFQAVHQWLGDNGLLKQAPSSGGSCGVR